MAWTHPKQIRLICIPIETSLEFNVKTSKKKKYLIKFDDEEMMSLIQITGISSNLHNQIEIILQLTEFIQGLWIHL